MFGIGGFKAEKAEIQCRLALGRIKLQRNKKEIGLKQSRKDVAQLLRDGKQEYARIRVEGVIREQLMLQAFEILELFLELIAVRSQLIAKNKEIPRDMIEAISSIIYSANRVPDSPELITIKKMFESKYGGEYAKEAASDLGALKWQVNANLLRCLLIEAPSGEAKLACLSEIAQEHAVDWDASAAARDLLPPPPVPSLTSSSLPTAGIIPGQGSSSYASSSPPPVPSNQPWPQTPQAPYPVTHQPQPHQPPQQVSLPPPPPPGLVTYINASQAAAAAAHAANQAKAAADFAAQFAMQSAGLAPPPQPLLAPTTAVPPPPPPPPTNHEQHPNLYQVQKAYDNALGPPTKEEKEELQLPSAPPTPPQQTTSSSSDPPQDTEGLPPSVPLTIVPPPAPSTHEGAFSSLPSPPRVTVAPQPEEEEDEYSALARRLAQLKKS